MSALFFTGNSRRAAEHILSTPAGQRIAEVGAIDAQSEWLGINLADDAWLRLSSGESIMWEVLASLANNDAPIQAVQFFDLQRVDDAHWDAVIVALFLARGRAYGVDIVPLEAARS